MSNNGPRRGFDFERRYNDMQLRTYWHIYDLFECRNPGDLDKAKMAVQSLQTPLNAQEFIEFRKEVKAHVEKLKQKSEELSSRIESNKGLLSHYKKQNQDLQNQKSELKSQKQGVIDTHLGKKQKKGGCTLF